MNLKEKYLYISDFINKETINILRSFEIYGRKHLRNINTNKKNCILFYNNYSDSKNNS